MTPLVSILIPCFNAASWLSDTLESALTQTWPRCEIIVVDDGSSDDSVAWARRFADRGVIVVTQPNRGASAARNRALQLARGEFIQFLDADDLLHAEKITQQMKLLAANPNAIVAGRWGRFERDPEQARFVVEENWRDSSAVEWLMLNFAGRGMMPPAAWLVGRSVLEQAGPWDERLSLNDDGEYFCRVILQATEIKFCRDAICYYRSNLSGSLSRRRTQDAWESNYLSLELCAHHLLLRQNDARTRRACADMFQRLAFEVYPEFPSLMARCETEAARYGGSQQRAGGGKFFLVSARLVGWKIARRIQRLRRRRSVPSEENP